MSLNAELYAFRSEFMAHVPPEAGLEPDEILTAKQRRTSCKHFEMTT